MIHDYSQGSYEGFRNEIGWPELLTRLKWMQKREERLVLLCPKCKEMITGVNDQ